MTPLPWVQMDKCVRAFKNQIHNHWISSQWRYWMVYISKRDHHLDIHILDQMLR